MRRRRKLRRKKRNRSSCLAELALEKLAYLESEQQLLVRKRFNAESCRAARANRHRDVVRDTTSSSELTTILGWLPCKTCSNARVRLALLLLSTTGLRISNLLILSVR